MASSFAKIMPVGQDNTMKATAPSHKDNADGSSATRHNAFVSFFVRMWEGYIVGLGWLVTKISLGSRNLGKWTFRHPVLMVIVTTVLAILISLGWLRFRLEDRPEILCKCMQ